MRKKIISMLLSGISLMTVFSCACAEQIEVEFSDASMGLSRNPYMQNGVLMVPLREVAEKLNYLVTWNENENSVDLLKLNDEAKIYLDSETCLINGIDVKLPCKSEILDDNMYCPLAFIKELSRLNFSWNYEENTLTILASSTEFNAFSFAKNTAQKRIVIKNPLEPSKFSSVEAAYVYSCYPSKENVYITDECVVQECKSGGNGEWAYSKYDTKELKSVLAQMKTQCEIRFWAKTTSEEGNTVTFTVKTAAGPNVATSFEVGTDWKECKAVLDWNPQIDVGAAYALIGMRRFSAGEKIFIDGLSVNPVE